MSLHADVSMSVGTDWSLIKGWDSDGPTILQDLLALKGGSLRGDALSEFLCDLIRESTPSPAAYPSIPYLMDAVDFLPWDESFEVMYTVAFIITRSSVTGSPPVPPELGEYFSNDFKMRLQAQLLTHCSKGSLSPIELVYLCINLFQLNGLEELATAVYNKFFEPLPCRLSANIPSLATVVHSSGFEGTSSTS
jgi:hypothetical protein